MCHCVELLGSHWRHCFANLFDTWWVTVRGAQGHVDVNLMTGALRANLVPCCVHAVVAFVVELWPCRTRYDVTLTVYVVCHVAVA